MLDSYCNVHVRVTVALAIPTRFRVCSWALIQVKLNELILLTTEALMETNDTESDRLANKAVSALDELLTLNNELYIGIGVSDVNHASSAEVSTDRTLPSARPLKNREGE